MTDQLSLTVTPEEYQMLLLARIERGLRVAEIPEQIVKSLLEASARLLPADVTPVVRPGTNGRSRPIAAASHGGKTDKRSKIHWTAEKPVEKPSTISDHVLNALQNRCLTAPEIAKAVRKPRKAVYTAIWRLRDNGLIDKGPIPVQDNGAEAQQQA